MKFFTNSLVAIALTVSSQADWKIAGEALKASDGSSGDWFGLSVDVGKKYTVVGAPQVSMGGAVYVFEKDSNGDWVEFAILDQPVMPTLPAPLENAEVNIGWFGASVAVAEKSNFLNANPSMIVIGAPATSIYHEGDNITTGAICTYELNDNVWEQQNTCTLGRLGFVQGSSSSFGTSVDISNWTSSHTQLGGLIIIKSHANIIAGDPDYDRKYQDVGSASFFDYNATGHSWNLEAFVEGFGNGDSNFARSVAIYNDAVIIGEIGHDIVDPNDDPDDDQVDMIWNIGAAHYFSAAGVHTETKYPAHEETEGNHHFGTSVDIYGEYSIVGEEHRTGGTSSSAVYILKNRIFHNYIENGSRGYGFSVAINDTHAAVGVLNGPGEGSVYMYGKDNNGNWDTHEPFYWLDIVKGSAFGIDVALDGDKLMVGAPLKDEVKQFEFVKNPAVNPALIMYLLN